MTNILAKSFEKEGPEDTSPSDDAVKEAAPVEEHQGLLAASQGVGDRLQGGGQQRGDMGARQQAGWGCSAALGVARV